MRAGDRYEELCAGTSLGGPRPLQHRRRRLRQAPQPATPWRWCTRTSAAPPRGPLGRAAGAGQPGRQPARRARRREGRPRRAGPAADAGDRRALLRDLEARARSCSRCRSSTATRASRHRLGDAEPKVLVTDAANASRFDRAPACRSLVLDPALLAAESDRCETADTSAEDPAQLYYTSGTTGLAKGIVHAHRYLLAHDEFELLPRRAGRRALPRHGRVGLGGGDLPAARALAARRDPVRLPARGRLRPRPAARLPLPQRGHRTSSRRRRRCAR